MEVDRCAGPGFAPGWRSFYFRRNLYEPHNEPAETLRSEERRVGKECRL